jgi:hypothetical protein
MLSRLFYWREVVPVLARKLRVAGVMRRALLRRPSACLGLWCNPTIVKCGRDLSAARSA